MMLFLPHEYTGDIDEDVFFLCTAVTCLSGSIKYLWTIGNVCLSKVYRYALVFWQFARAPPFLFQNIDNFEQDILRFS